MRVKDLKSEVSPLHSVPVVRYYPYVFLGDIPGFPPKEETNFCIELLSNKKPISIPLYWMPPAKLQELKLQRKDLLDKGFKNRVFLLWALLCFA